MTARDTKRPLPGRRCLRGGRSRLEETCAPGAQGWREDITSEEYGELLILLDVVLRGLLGTVTGKLNNGTEVKLKGDGSGIEITRKEGGKSVVLRG